MLRLTKATHDQLEMLLSVNDRTPSCVPVKALGESLNLTPPNALKHAGRLVQAGLLRAKRGPGGGVMLARPASAIGLGAAIRLLEEINTNTGAENCARADRSFNFLSEALTQFIDLLDDFTLADLASGRSPAVTRLAHARGRKMVPRISA